MCSRYIFLFLFTYISFAQKPTQHINSVVLGNTLSQPIASAIAPIKAITKSTKSDSSRIFLLSGVPPVGNHRYNNFTKYLLRNSINSSDCRTV